MARIKHAVSTRRRKKRVLKRAKGQFGHRSKRFSQAKRSLLKSLSYADRDHKVNKRDYRRLWIVRIKAACEANDILYSRFMKGLKEAKVELKLLEGRRVADGTAQEALPQAKTTKKPAAKGKS